VRTLTITSRWSPPTSHIQKRGPNCPPTPPQFARLNFPFFNALQEETVVTLFFHFLFFLQAGGVCEITTFVRTGPASAFSIFIFFPWFIFSAPLVIKTSTVLYPLPPLGTPCFYFSPCYFCGSRPPLLLVDTPRGQPQMVLRTFRRRPQPGPSNPFLNIPPGEITRPPLKSRIYFLFRNNKSSFNFFFPHGRFIFCRSTSGFPLPLFSVDQFE